jgi:hypothetical protein
MDMQKTMTDLICIDGFLTPMALKIGFRKDNNYPVIIGLLGNDFLKLTGLCFGCICICDYVIKLLQLILRKWTHFCKSLL